MMNPPAVTGKIPLVSLLATFAADFAHAQEEGLLFFSFVYLVSSERFFLRLIRISKAIPARRFLT